MLHPEEGKTSVDWHCIRAPGTRLGIGYRRCAKGPPNPGPVCGHMDPKARVRPMHLHWKGDPVMERSVRQLCAALARNRESDRPAPPLVGEGLGEGLGASWSRRVPDSSCEGLRMKAMGPVRALGLRPWDLLGGHCFPAVLSRALVRAHGARFSHATRFEPTHPDRGVPVDRFAFHRSPPLSGPHPFGGRGG